VGLIQFGDPGSVTLDQWGKVEEFHIEESGKVNRNEKKASVIIRVY
jgi:hypothetical protein